MLISYSESFQSWQKTWLCEAWARYISHMVVLVVCWPHWGICFITHARTHARAHTHACKHTRVLVLSLTVPPFNHAASYSHYLLLWLITSFAVSLVPGAAWDEAVFYSKSSKFQTERASAYPPFKFSHLGKLGQVKVFGGGCQRQTVRGVGALGPQRITIHLLWFLLFSSPFHPRSPIFHFPFSPLLISFPWLHSTCTHCSLSLPLSPSSALEQFWASEIFKPFHNSVVVWNSPIAQPPPGSYLFPILPTSLHGTCLIPLVPTLRCHS